VIKEEGFSVLYRGVSLTALRQGTNQAANFTAYTFNSVYAVKLAAWLVPCRRAVKETPRYKTLKPSSQLPAYQTTMIGLISGAVGPFSNAPIDTIKTRLQRR
jgi:solute carrier family 25 citrate transporter 1